MCDSHFVAAEDTSQSLPFIPLGSTTGASLVSLLAVNNGVSGVINVPRGFPFGNTTHTSVYVRLPHMIIAGRVIHGCTESIIVSLDKQSRPVA